jgi:uncharacterized protein YciI
MTLFAVLFEDHAADADEIRRRLMPDHLAFLERHAGAIQAAGPLRLPDGSAAGGLWLVMDETAEAVEHLVHEDPFWPTGLRKSVRICAWTQVFAEGVRQI